MGKWQRTFGRNSWNKDIMITAIEAVKKEMSAKNASKLFEVPRTTLRRRVRDKNLPATGNKKVLGSRKPVFEKGKRQFCHNHLFASALYPSDATTGRICVLSTKHILQQRA